MASVQEIVNNLSNVTLVPPSECRLAVLSGNFTIQSAAHQIKGFCTTPDHRFSGIKMLSTPTGQASNLFVVVMSESLYEVMSESAKTMDPETAGEAHVWRISPYYPSKDRASDAARAKGLNVQIIDDGMALADAVNHVSEKLDELVSIGALPEYKIATLPAHAQSGKERRYFFVNFDEVTPTQILMCLVMLSLPGVLKCRAASGPPARKEQTEPRQKTVARKPAAVADTYVPVKLSVNPFSVLASE